MTHLHSRFRAAAAAILAAGLTAACGRGHPAQTESAGGVAAMGSSTGATAAPAPAAGGTTAAAAAVPRSVEDLGTHAEDLYDAVSARNWRAAASILDSLDASARSLPPDARLASDRQSVTAVLDTLRRAVPARQHDAAVIAANHVTYLAARMSEPFHPMPPVQVPLLDYYGRELVIWAARSDTARLHATTTAIRNTWNAVRPQVEQRHGAAAARGMDADVRRVEQARTPRQFASAAKPLLDQVDVLEKVFARP